MAKVAAMDPQLLSTPNAGHLRRGESCGHSAGLSDSFDGVSPRSMPLTPESFVVTPQGKTLPAIREIHIDRNGGLLVVERPVAETKLADESAPTIHEVPLVRFQNSPFADTPIDMVAGLQLTRAQPLQLRWEQKPLLTWSGPYKGGVEMEEGPRRSVKIVKVDAQGVAHVIEVRAREYERRFGGDSEGEFIVQKDGTVHHAHRVFVNTGDRTEVFIREDECITGSVFDNVPTPELTLTPDMDVVFISDLEGRTYRGAPCMISCAHGAAQETLVFYRIACLPQLFPRDSFRKAITYTAPPMIAAKPQPREATERVAVGNRDGEVLEVFHRILLARGDGVVKGYHTDGVHCAVSEDGKTTKMVTLRDGTPSSPFQENVYICTRHHTCFVGRNVLIATPHGLRPVAAITNRAEEDLVEKEEVGSCGFGMIPGVEDVVGLPNGLCPFLLLTHKQPLLLKMRGKREKFPPTSLKGNRVFICSCDGPLYPMLYPAEQFEFDGVLIAAPKGTLKGHSVIKMSVAKNGPSEICFACDE